MDSDTLSSLFVAIAISTSVTTIVALWFAKVFVFRHGGGRCSSEADNDKEEANRRRMDQLEERITDLERQLEATKSKKE